LGASIACFTDATYRGNALVLRQAALKGSKLLNKIAAMVSFVTANGFRAA
jgi:hypothetical protein